jgi:hypothetical protein
MSPDVTHLGFHSVGSIEFSPMERGSMPHGEDTVVGLTASSSTQGEDRWTDQQLADSHSMYENEEDALSLVLKEIACLTAKRQRAIADSSLAVHFAEASAGPASSNDLRLSFGALDHVERGSMALREPVVVDIVTDSVSCSGFDDEILAMLVGPRGVSVRAPRHSVIWFLGRCAASSSR